MAKRAMGLAGVLTVAGVLACPGVAHAGGGGLGDAAARTGRYVGAAVQLGRLGDPAYTGILDREFSSVTPENVLEWDAVEPARGRYVFTAADRIVDHATANGMRVRGRGLVAPSANHVAWLASVPPADMPSVLAGHITAALTHYRGRVQTWDVVSEAFFDSGAPRPSVFQRTMGAGYLEAAFVAARAADPTAARLCYNDYRIEDLSHPKTQAVYGLVADFKARGVPIDCVGLQSHFTTVSEVPASYRATVEAFAALGVDVEITELDIGGTGPDQAAAYGRVVAACVAVPRCTGITVWGVRDVDSWRPNLSPLLFDAAGDRKPAYYAVRAALCRRTPSPVRGT